MLSVYSSVWGRRNKVERGEFRGGAGSPEGGGGGGGGVGGGLDLHAVGRLVVFRAGGQVPVLGVFLEVGQVQLLQNIEVAALMFAVFPGRWSEVQYG